MAVVEGAIIYSNLLVLLGIGLTLTYITTGVPNFAQGSFAIFGSYVSLSFVHLVGVHPYYSLPVSLAIGGLLGMIVYVGVLGPSSPRGRRCHIDGSNFDDGPDTVGLSRSVL